MFSTIRGKLTRRSTILHVGKCTQGVTSQVSFNPLADCVSTETLLSLTQMAPKESPGLFFMGWLIQPGIRYMQQLIIADLDNFKSGKFSRRLLKQCPEVEVHIRDKVVFPFALVADANIERPLQRHAIGDDPEAQPKPVALIP